MPCDKEDSDVDTVQAVLLNARISALVVTGNVVATALKTSFASEALVHVYSTTWQRLDATVAMQLVQSCILQEPRRGRGAHSHTCCAIHACPNWEETVLRGLPPGQPASMMWIVCAMLTWTDYAKFAALG